MAARTRPRVLVTAFEPFDRRRSNRSARWLKAFVAEAARSGLAHRCDLAAAILPVDFVALPRVLARLWRAERPTVWILLGESGRGHAIRVERVAVNLLDAPIPDNAGRRRRDVPVLRNGPPAWFATLDPRRAQRALERGGVRAALSLSAGTYCCNQAYYHARHLAHRTRTRVLFLHVPRLALDRRHPAPRLDDAARGLVALVQSAIRT